MSLERKLPILIGGLVACVLLATLAIVYVEVRSNAIDTATERLRNSARTLVAAIEPGVQNRIRQLDDVAASPAVVGLARGDTTARTEALRALATLRTRTDSIGPLQIIGRDGAVLAQLGGQTAVTLPETPAPRAQPAGAVFEVSPFIRDDDRLLYWTISPIRSANDVVGYITQLRTLQVGATGELIEGLVGGNTALFFAHREGGPWAPLEGGALESPPAVPELDRTFLHDAADGTPHYAYAAPVQQTEWLVVAQTPQPAVLARSNQVLRRIAFVGVLLMLLGGIAAWFVSRSVTRPLSALGGAADAIARGDYSRRTGLERDDEIGSLARSFDAMAGHVDATHAELERRFEHAQRLAAELEVARVDALQANRAKSDFLATMSHEIRTPINAVIGYTDLLDAGVAGELPPQQRAYVERIRLSSEHLITVVNDVLDFAKIESGQMRMSATSLPAADTIAAACAILHAPALERGIEIRSRCTDDARFIGDAHRVQQILLNLLSNALKFSPPNECIDISCDARTSRAPGTDTPRDWTCITVTDRGPGIAHDQLEQIFEPFIQGNAGYTRSHGGTGLGLAIARSLARMMDGDLSVESRPGQGAAFTVWLPAA